MDSNHKKKLTWMCRRGTRELDQITLYYLQKHYDDADPKQKETFEKLLELSDPELQNLLIYGNTDSDESINTLATFIRTHYPH